MILSRRIALDGVQLDELDSRIVIRSIDPGLPKESVSAVNRMGGVGQRVTAQHWETLDVTVSFAMDIRKRELAARKALFDLVMDWADRKGWLTVNYIPGRRVYVDKVIPPASGDLWEWDAEYTITFRAYNVPFWQDEAPSSATMDGAASGSIALDVPGQMETPVDAVFENISGKVIQDFSISAGGKTLNLAGVNIPADGVLRISHGTDGLLRATVGETSVYGKITGSDDLVCGPGSVTVSFTATRAGKLTVSATGRYK